MEQFLFHSSHSWPNGKQGLNGRGCFPCGHWVAAKTAITIRQTECCLHKLSSSSISTNNNNNVTPQTLPPPVAGYIYYIRVYSSNPNPTLVCFSFMHKNYCPCLGAHIFLNWQTVDKLSCSNAICVSSLRKKKRLITKKPHSINRNYLKNKLASRYHITSSCLMW